MTFPKRTFEKPIPISPLIALDRERCILCYRCTRFSEEVAEDGQLVAINRGAQSVIATFEDEPYDGHFSGNVTELCPVGALTSTQYRFEARPWEIQNVPTVCGLCPVGCNITATTREGKVKRILSRNHPEIDEGWLCDKGRFAFAHLDARDRITAPLAQGRPAPLREALLGRRARPGRGAAARRRRVDRDGALRRRVGRGGLRARQAAARRGSARTPPCCPRSVPDVLDACRAPLSALRDAKTIAVVCDEPVVERAPVVELWLKAARRAGATITYERADGRGRRARHRRAAASPFGARDVYYLPQTPNGRGVTDAWSAAGDGEPVDEKPALVVISGDEAAADPAVRAMAAEAEIVIGIGMFEDSFRGIADLVLPGTSYLERDGTTINLEGRLQRQRRAVLAPVPDVLAWIAKLAERFDVDAVAARVARLRRDLREVLRRRHLRRGRRARRRCRPARSRATDGDRSSSSRPAAEGLRLVAYRPLFSGAAVERTPELQFQRPAGEVQISRADANARKIRNGADR